MKSLLEFRIETLTPIWTGGANSKVDRVHETGIIGSLRWWFEVLVRGLGGDACEATTQECLFDPQKPNNGICDVCRSFGATGWRRRFRLIIEETNTSSATIIHPIKANRQYIGSNQKLITPTWYFPDPTIKNARPQPANTPKQGTLTIRIQSMDKNFSPEVIGGLFQFIGDWAAIGAKAQMGFGVINLENNRIETRPLYDRLVALTGSREYGNLPSLQNLFLARIQMKNAGEEETFNLKYDLRRRFASDTRLRHFIMGTAVKNDRIAAKVKMSRPYGDGLLRVWGWIPEEKNVYGDSWNREKVIDAIYQHLKTNYTLEVWREMNSPRDTDLPNNRDALLFLRSLLRPGGEDDAM